MTAWATVADAATYTGMTVSDAEIAQAQAIVELFADVTADVTAGAISSKNVRLLKMAVAYQAAWITTHSDLYTHHDASSASQDQVTFSPAHANSALLAPLAKRCIDRLSWRRTRSLRIGPMSSGRGLIPRRMNTTSAVLDDNDSRWEPLGGER